MNDTPETDAFKNQYSHHFPNWLAEQMAEHSRRMERERNHLRELRKGDFELTKALAEAAGIPITASDSLPGLQWEQFDKGVVRLAAVHDIAIDLADLWPIPPEIESVILRLRAILNQDNQKP